MSRLKRNPEETLNEWITRITKKKKKVYTPKDVDILLVILFVVVLVYVVIIELVHS